ncbi:MAG: hypothetical protein CMJ89_04010, partial [Planctomycetes bacterium]|nr:hypothetical protein [Planctomycetota bacterium]
LTLFFQSDTTPGDFPLEPSLTLMLPTNSNPESVAAADLDGDGDMDLVSANSQNLTLFFQSDTKPGEFADPDTLSGDGPVLVAAADLDGDGDMDLVSAASGGASDNLILFFQSDTAPGEFIRDPNPLSVTFPQSIITTDLDGDGDMDLVSANGSTGDLKCFFQTSPGVFSPDPISLPTGGFPESVAAADLDGDGDMDLVSANGGSDDLTLFFNGR